jgi:hypothetical protein
MGSASMMAGAVQTSATIAVAIAAIGLPIYQLRRDGLLPRLRRRD